MAFMMFFNSWYYSFSPAVATHLSTHQTQRTIFRYGLYPLIGILYASYYSYLLVSPFNNEVAALTAGLIAAGMLGIIYLALPLYLARRVLRRRGRFSILRVSNLAAWSALSGVFVAVAYLAGAEFALGIATVSLILSALTLGASLGTRNLSRVYFTYSMSQIAVLSRLLKPLASSAAYQLRKSNK